MADVLYARLATMCVESIRHHHPLSHIVHMTDDTTPALPEVDEVWRSTKLYPGEPWYMHEYVSMLASMDKTPTAIVGSDTLMCKPVDDVWQHEFDMALTWRPNHPAMPYNMGITFCRNPAFFGGMLARMDADPKLCEWMGDQKALALEAASGKWKIHELQCTEWNNSDMNDRTIPKARMLHYKGIRKEYMPRHYKAGVWK